MDEDYARHQEKINGTALAPYRYRVLSDAILELVMRAAPINSPNKYEIVAFVFRIIQNLVIFLLAFKFYRSFNLTPSISILGLLILAYCMCFMFYAADLSFYIYTQLAFFLLAGILINRNFSINNWLIPILTIVATLNREEAVFIPVMFLISKLSANKWHLPESKKDLVIAFLPFALFLLTFFGLRLLIGETTYSNSRYGPIYPGFHLLWLNVRNSRTWINLFQAYGLLPFAILFFKKWSNLLKSYLLFLVLPWFALQLLFGSTDETRLFLVPFALVFVPAGLSLLSTRNKILFGNP
jgi:hypothetical protein